jgi:hypothetical protein
MVYSLEDRSDKCTSCRYCRLFRASESDSKPATILSIVVQSSTYPRWPYKHLRRSITQLQRAQICTKLHKVHMEDRQGQYCSVSLALNVQATHVLSFYRTFLLLTTSPPYSTLLVPISCLYSNTRITYLSLILFADLGEPATASQGTACVL